MFLLGMGTSIWVFVGDYSSNALLLNLFRCTMSDVTKQQKKGLELWTWSMHEHPPKQKSVFFLSQAIEISVASLV